MNELDKLKKEKLLLEKQNNVLKKQAHEIRKDIQELHEKYATLDRNAKNDAMKNQEHYTVTEFIDGVDGPSSLLKNAILYRETHDGCPFLSIGCENAPENENSGIWIKMGVLCDTFAKKIKICMKSLNGISK